MDMKVTRETPSDQDLEGTPVSVKIRERIKAAKKRFHANDNIADFIEPGDIDALRKEVEAKMLGVLQSLVIDTESDHNTQDTAKRGVQWSLSADAFRHRVSKCRAFK
jgi:GTP cyclohydrolase IA